MNFRILGGIDRIETVATGNSIREIGRLRKMYGRARWRKVKGVATVEMRDGTVCKAEIHWYEAHGVGTKDMKIKKILEVI